MPHDDSTVTDGKNRSADSKQKNPSFCLRTSVSDAPMLPKRSRTGTANSTFFETNGAPPISSSFCSEGPISEFLQRVARKIERRGVEVGLSDGVQEIGRASCRERV